MRINALTIFWALGIAAAPNASVAQHVPPSMRTVTLIETPTSSTGSAATVLRRTAGDDRDVIVLTPTATADDLSNALRLLDVLHAQLGDSVTRDVGARVRSVRRTGGLPRARDPLHASFVSELRRAKARAVNGFGSVKAHQILVPRIPDVVVTRISRDR